MTDSMTTGRKLGKAARVMNALPVLEFMKLDGETGLKSMQLCDPEQQDRKY
jgi:hypothetical protein